MGVDVARAGGLRWARQDCSQGCALLQLRETKFVATLFPVGMGPAVTLAPASVLSGWSGHPWAGDTDPRPLFDSLTPFYFSVNLVCN